MRMPSNALHTYRTGYAALLRLYPTPYRARFGEGMAQTFHDVCRERLASQQHLFLFVLWMFLETSVGAFHQHMMTLNKRIARLALIVGMILLIPFFGNLYVDGWNWSVFDFIGMGGLMFSVGLAYEFVARKGGGAYRAAVGLALLGALLLFWVNGAVGLIGDENPANGFYMLLVLALPFSAAAARLKPRGMMIALTVIAIAQAIIPVVALIFWPTNFAPGVVQVFILNAFFVAMFAGSALLFREAGTKKLAA